MKSLFNNEFLNSVVWINYWCTIEWNRGVVWCGISNNTVFTPLLNILFVSYFPIQNFEKILSSKSSVVTVPVISPR